MKSFLARTYKFFFGLFLFLLYRKTLNYNELVKGKRVALVGAASSAYNTGLGTYIESFDHVVRINKAPHLLKTGKWDADLGRKSTILFHSFYENEQSGGGSLDLSLYDSLGIRWIINPIAAYSGYRVIFNFYKKYLSKKTMYTLPREQYKKIEKGLNGFQPTIGFCALMSTIESDFSELYITGFTFFKTAFGEGYRNEIREADQAQKFIKEAGVHNPDYEFTYFLKLLKNNQHKKITMDSTLTGIVASYQ